MKKPPFIGNSVRVSPSEFMRGHIRIEVRRDVVFEPISAYLTIDEAARVIAAISASMAAAAQSIGGDSDA